jgi:hypothetical protein
MFSKNRNPKWWQLYVSFLVLVPAFLAENRLHISTRGHQAVQFGIILVFYGFMLLWIRINSAAMSYLDRERYTGSFKLVLPSSSDLAGPDGEQRQILDLPDAEIKGLLGDTFEMDYIDAEFVSPADKVEQEKKKE